MGTRPCPECGERLSSSAEACMKCGAAVKRITIPERIIGFVLVLLLALLAAWLLGAFGFDPVSPPGT